MYNILICDDEPDIVSALQIYLSGQEYRIFTAGDGSEVLQILKNEEIHVVLMDIMMPKVDGITALKKLRENYNVPVILLTAKGEDADKVLGLNVGADDYITKPFNPAEVVARVRSQVRRYTQLGSKPQVQEFFSVGNLEMDNRTKTVTRDSEPVTLTPKEYDILKLLMEHPGQVFSPKEIYRLVWSDSPYGAENTVAVHIRHLREKLEYNPAEPRYLKVVWGQGYKIEN